MNDARFPTQKGGGAKNTDFFYMHYICLQIMAYISYFKSRSESSQAIEPIAFTTSLIFPINFCL